MNGKRGICAATLIACVLALRFAAAAVPPAAQMEIEYLLARLSSSQCEFNRNGSWYDASEAEQHLRDKYNYLVGRNGIGSAEDFIEKAASRSYLSGRSYRIRCQGGVEIDTGQWLRERLTEYRAAQ